MKYIYKKSLLILAFSFFLLSVSNAQNARVTIGSSAASGDYDAQLAAFAPCDFRSISGVLALGEDDFGTATGCNANGDLSDITSNVSGKVALMDRGNCAFTDKVFAAQEAGAIAVIMCNNEADPPLLTMSGENDQVIIPSLMLSQADCSVIRADIDNNIEVTLQRTGIEDINADDEVIWGANGEGSFNGGLGDWTTSGISAAEHVWDWSPDGAGKGALFSDIIASKTGCDGAAIFDFDFLHTGGLEENLPSSPIPILEGELISPTMDLRGADAVAIKFFQHNLPLNGENQLATSIDGGVTWSDPIVITTENVLTAAQDNRVGTEIRRLALPGVAGESNVKVKFIAEGDFYFWSIDDVEIVKLTGNNAEMVESFYTPLSYAFPQAHADADTFFFSGQVRNSGGNILDAVRLSVEVVQDATGEVVHTDSGTENNIPLGEIVSIATDNLWVPIGLDVGTYTITYTISVLDAAETTISDNTTTKIFEVTDNLFTKEPGPLDNGFYSGLGVSGEWAAATVYRMSNSVEDYVATNAITSITSRGENLTDNFIDVFLAKLKNGLDFTAGSFEFNETDLLGHPSFDIISQNTHVFTTEAQGDLISIPFSSSGQGVPLEPGESYLVIIRFDGSQAGAAEVPNSDLFLAYNTDPKVGMPDVAGNIGFASDFVISKEQGQWFTGFSGDPAPVIRMQVEFMSDTDDIPLPSNAFNAYPNPTSEKLYVELDLEETMDATIVMASLDGKIIDVKELSSVSKRNLDYNVAHLAAGTYIIKVYTEVGSSTQKIIITK